MAIFSREEYSSTWGIGMAAGLAPGSSAPKRSSWPEILSRWAWLMLSMTGPAICMRALRLQPILSKAPALIKFSIARRFSSRPDIRRQKSSKSEKGPFFSRSATRLLMAPQPMPFMATRPKRRFSPATVKSASDSFTSGGSSFMPSSRHSAMYSATLVLLSKTEVSRAAMYCRG